jgi:ribose 5-phosphate isomerase A
VGIPLAGLESELELTVDGADEVDPQLNLIKGYGGALVRERIVAAAARRRVILVTADKLVWALGGKGLLPIEVLPFAALFCRRRLEILGLKSALRTDDDRPFVTDNRNVIIDLRIEPITDAPALERSIRSIPGVVDTGLFLEMADTVLVADGSTVRELTRQKAR